MREEADCRSHDRGDGGFVTKEGENEENENQYAIPVHDGLKLIGQVPGKKPKDDLLTVQRPYGDQVEDGQANIGQDQWDEKYRENRRGKTDKDRNKNGQKEVADGSGDGDDSRVPTGILEVIRVKGSGFPPTKNEVRAGKGGKK
ncbi:MAG: hypothetical protein ACD_61C00196G0002 [uncultured bacterium]|nr:MAG: hypothetical protein ACD_61C00196G0002 [uncultured bacterium]